MRKNILSLLDQIRAIAAEGLEYAKDNYDIERYKKLMEIAAGEYSEAAGIPQNKIEKELKKEIGCITPKLGIDIAITNKEGKLLILKRTDDSKWGVPCGWANIGEKPLETAVREAKEETNILIKPLGYIAITAKGPDDYPKLAHQIDILVATEPVGKETKVKLNHEHSDYKWIGKKETNSIDWHPGHKRLKKPIFEFVKNGKYIPHFE
ncbi:MAG: NUDIX hydrolase N-terminal domain-containing protein [Candidatus Pacebacteria bacterium]|nr:NUDIX hydrolase N-terminal domain-containing protein [Candidatus Paceibacterota bacterium]